MILSLGFSSCNLPESKTGADGQIDATQAYLTVQARLTESAIKLPSSTVPPAPTPTVAPSPTTQTVTATPQPTQPPTAVPTTACDLAAAGNPIDVTIPDDTKMLPGQTFTKTWRLQNVGKCSWTTAYSLALFSGEAMGAPTSIALTKNVNPGETIDISVDLVAPQTAGTYQGNWKLRNAGNIWFGIGPNGSSPFWVRIAVTTSASGTTTPTTTTTGTPSSTTPAVTSTPGVQVSGKKTLTPGDKLNLDNNTINNGGEDISWESDALNNLTLVPINGAQLAIFGAQPTLSDCQNAPLSASPIALEFMSPGMYLCYRTNLGLHGWLLLHNFKEAERALIVEFLTWAAP